MKRKVSLLAIVFAFTVLTSSVANAQSSGSQSSQNNIFQDIWDWLGLGGSGSGSGSTGGSTGGSQSSTQLPINGGVEFLAIAGMVIGVVAIKKAKTAEQTI